MKAILGNQNVLIGLGALRMVFAEVVNIHNSRPFTPSSDDPSEPETLTLNHLLLRRKQLALLPGLFVHEDLYRRKQRRRAQFLVDCLLKRWIEEYVHGRAVYRKKHKFNIGITSIEIIGTSSKVHE